jgi:phage gp16-like protein
VRKWKQEAAMPKRTQLAQIHIAKKELGLGEENYRGMLRELYRRESSADLSERQAADLIDHFRRLGWRPRRGPHRLASRAQIGLIYVLWHKLEEAGALEHPGLDALASFVAHRTGKENLHRLDAQEASRVIEGLKKWLERESGAG